MIREEEYNITKTFNGFANKYQAKEFAVTARQNEIEAQYSANDDSVTIYIERNREMPWEEDDLMKKANDIYSSITGRQYKDINENRKNMKKTITESQLRNIISEAVKGALKESTLYGDTKPFEEIYRAANQIMDRFQYTQEDDYEDMSDDGVDMGTYVWQWAKKVAEDADYYLNCHSKYRPINGGENW